MTSVGALLPRDLPASEILDFARRAERLGFDELWVVEDLGFRGGIAQAAAVLAATERIRVGLGILPAAARNVAFAAMEIASLEELFPGRVDVGIGHGMPHWMRQVGVWPASPLTLLEEYFVALRALLAGESVSVEGRYVRLRDFGLTERADAVPRLLAGVRGPKSLQLAGRVADGVILAEPVTPEYLGAARESTGGGYVVAFAVAAVDADAEAARAAVRPGLAAIGEPDWAPHITPLPFAAEFADLRAQCADGAEFAQRMPAAWVDQLAVVGTAADASGRIAQLHAAGADSVVLLPAGRDPHAALEALAGVLP
ncbi:LLM class flavin-dependent oxidoreductase [Microbacteriaceae bacterium VKM Ac-2854]|nr:LLM class flavin-dependent oxidoreductase [Microbacteriaceae bacterium VKM Ac-2854]